MASGNTISTYAYRRKYLLARLNRLLRKGLIAEKICDVDRTGGKYIDAPYGPQPTTIVQTIGGAYTPAQFTVVDELLTVTDEFIVSEHVHDFEQSLAKFDIIANRLDEMTYSVKTAIDKFVLNEVCERANGTYTTPAGGFTTAANFNTILSFLLSKVAGYDTDYDATFLVVENTDLPGIIQAMGAQGFSMADAALKNGFLGSYMGVDIYVVRTGTFIDANPGTVAGTKSWTNADHRVFGVKNVSTYAAPRGIKYEEKGVTGLTGKEYVVFGYIGFKAWVAKYDLLIDITIV